MSAPPPRPRPCGFLEKERELLAACPEHHAVLVPSLAGMRTWMRGNLDWSRSTRRYRPVEGDEEIRPEEYLEASLMKVDQ
jgi:hypothetical protein